MTESAELLSKATNYAVVQLPGRKFPGVVFQGDSLHALIVSLSRMRAEAARHGDDELNAGFEELSETLGAVMGHYESVCQTKGIPLPYCK
jgi:hypothetical protein